MYYTVPGDGLQRKLTTICIFFQFHNMYATLLYSTVLWEKLNDYGRCRLKLYGANSQIYICMHHHHHKP